nr:gastric inhibitory polypeptide receptor isoform X2 [Equus asinus]
MPTCPPWRLLLLLLLWGVLLGRAETGPEGQTAGELYRRWERYRRECQETLEAAEPPAGLACNRSFDMYVCWDYAAPNATARASCPWYLPWHRHVATGFVLRQCGSDGQWEPWRDHSQCENPEKNGDFQEQRLTLERLQVVYTVGYSVSLAALLLALLILSFFRRLHCTRNHIHINLFTSFMLRAAAILTRDRLLPPPGPYPGDQPPALWNQALAACRTAQIVTQYCVGANYTWLLVEGIYLHSLLVHVGRSEEGHFHCYLLLGWGEPRPCPLPGACASDAPTTLLVYLRGSPPLSRLLLPHPGGAVPRVLGLAGPVRALTAAAGLGGGGRGLRRGPRAFRHSLGDRQVPVREHAVLGTERRQGHLVDHTHPYPHDHLGTASPASSRSSSGISHPKRGATLCSPGRDPGCLSLCLSSQINFLIFIRILGILVSKLRTRQMRCPDYRLRLARSTLTLVPLLGVHEVVFAPLTEEQARGALRFAKLGFEIFLSSFQGFLVSILYCFINKEVGSPPSGGRAGNRAPGAASERRPVAGAVGDPPRLAPLPPAPQPGRGAAPAPGARLPDPARGPRPRPGRQRPRSVLGDPPGAWG